MSGFLKAVGSDSITEFQGLTKPTDVSLGALLAFAAKYYYTKDIYASVITGVASILGHAVGHTAVSSQMIPDVLLAMPPVTSAAISSAAAVYGANWYTKTDMKENMIISGATYIGSVGFELLAMFGIIQ